MNSTTTGGYLVFPPTRSFKRPRRWETFEALFDPIVRQDDTVLWEPWDVPRDADARHWWTVLDCDGRLLLCAGFHFVNRFAYVQCANAWGGEWSDHPEYLY